MSFINISTQILQLVTLSSVTGITASFLETQPCFPDVASKLIEFIGLLNCLAAMVALIYVF